MRISVQGIGVVGGFGCGITDLKKALSHNKALPQGFIADTSSLDKFVPKRKLRRIDHFSQMAILGAYLALEDAGKLEINMQDVGTIIATGYGASQTTFGFLDSLIDDGDSCASPTLFSSSVHNAAAANVSIILKATGPSLTVSQFDMSIPSALLTACQWLEEGRVGWVLFGGVDEYCDVLGYCRRRFMDKEYDSSATPMELSKQSPETGEGAAFFLLSRFDNKPSKYGSIVDVQMGRLKQETFPLPEDAVIFLDIDPNMECERFSHPRIIKTNEDIALYNSLYGNLPIGPAFDMAVACLSIKEKTLFASRESSPVIVESLKLIKKDEDLRPQPICCLKISKESEFGMVTLDRE